MDDRVRDLMYRVKKTATAVGETAESAARMPDGVPERWWTSPS